MDSNRKLKMEETKEYFKINYDDDTNAILGCFLEDDETAPKPNMLVEKDIWFEGQTVGANYLDKDGLPVLITVTPSAEEAALTEREWRNAQLDASDYIVLPDYPDTPYATAMKAYRILLRDYPATVDFPFGARPSKPDTIESSEVRV